MAQNFQQQPDRSGRRLKLKITISTSRVGSNIPSFTINTVKMPEPLIASIVVSSFRPVIEKVFRSASRIYAERKANKTNIPQEYLDDIFKETLERLRGKSVDRNWWQKVGKGIAHELVTPEFIQKPALQEWLNDESVKKDLISLAKEIVMGQQNIDTEPRTRLAKSYSSKTGEMEKFANGPIDVLLSILVSGLIVLIPDEQKVIAGMIQESTNTILERFDDLENRSSQIIPDSITQQAHTNEANLRLQKILDLRVFNPALALAQLRDLCTHVRNGELTATDLETKVEILNWTAKLCVESPETRPLANEIRNELRDIAPDHDLSTVDALLADAEGDNEKAIFILRDKEDAESHSTLFSLLALNKSESHALEWYSEKNGLNNVEFFTSVGWKNWATCMAKANRWDETTQQLLRLESLWDKFPALAYVEGIINAAMLLPNDFRSIAVESVPLYPEIAPSYGSNAEEHHTRALKCFTFVNHRFQKTNDEYLSKILLDWTLWIRLMDPNSDNSNAARDEVFRNMSDAVQAVRSIKFAYFFGVNYDSEPLKHYLDHRKNFGGLNDEEFFAELILSLDRLDPSELVSYLDLHKNRLMQIVVPAFLTTLLIDALVNDNQLDRARELLREQSSNFSSSDLNRLEMMIDFNEGQNPRENLQRQYEESNRLIDLKNLVNYLLKVNDSKALRPLVLKLFELEPNVDNAVKVLNCVGGSPFFDHNSVLDFINDNDDMVEQHDELKAAKVWALYNTGNIGESKLVNESLLKKRHHQNDLLNKVKIEISLGNWEEIPRTINETWQNRGLYDAKTLIHIAQLAIPDSQEVNRALEIANLAAEKSSDNPEILAAVYWLYFLLGHDDKANSNWIEQALEISSPEEGPIWSADLGELTTKLIPNQKKIQNEVEQKWLNGELPTTLTVRKLNLSLTRLFLHIPNQNSRLSDGRHRVMLPIISGVNKPTELQNDWTIGLDITSIIVLFHLELLDTVFDSFDHIKLAPNVIETLFLERKEVQFHQPNLIKKAEQIKQLLDIDEIQTEENLLTPPKSISDEVGQELSELLEFAKLNNGKVVCVQPIFKIGSLMKKTADVSGYEDLILSPLDICKLLHNTGNIDSHVFNRAEKFLSSQGQTTSAEISTSILDHPIYIDDLALSYLQDSNILQQLTVSKKFKIHPNVVYEINTRIAEGNLGEQLVSKIESIRDSLRNAIESGKSSFLPFGIKQSDHSQKIIGWYQGIESLLENPGLCDAVCIDDRIFNQYSTIANSYQNSTTIASILDILHHLVSQRKITKEEELNKRHNLRQAGFAFIPLRSDEVIHWLRKSKLTNNNLVESAELKTIRQTHAQINFLKLANATEIFELSSNITFSCKENFGTLWCDESLTPIQAKQLSDWVWNYLCRPTIFGSKSSDISTYSFLTRELLIQRVALTLNPIDVQSIERRSHYTKWLEQTVLKPLQLANSSIVGQALDIVCNAILSLPDHRDVFGSLFLAQLPTPTRNQIIDRNMSFFNECKFKPEQYIKLENESNIYAKDLFDASRTLFETKKTQKIHDTSGKELTVRQNDEKKIELNWIDSDGKSVDYPINVLSLLSRSSRIRTKTFKKILNDLGPTAIDVYALKNDIKSGELDNQKLSKVMEEFANGVITLQTNLVEKLNHNQKLTIVDLVPQSVVYFEKFCGPCPNDQSNQSYIKDVLVPYRKELLERDFQAGLEICCLGAIHDDLLPGKWVSRFKNDTVWNALSSFHKTENPFSLIATLDIAMYRQDDPRYQKLAEDVTSKLLHANGRGSDSHDSYNLLAILAQSIFNLINYVEGVPGRPGYWKQLCAWMQASFIAQQLATTLPPTEKNKFEQWLLNSRSIGGVYSELVDARKEPMMLQNNLAAPGALQHQTSVRMHSLKVRHESEGRKNSIFDNIHNPVDNIEHLDELITLNTLTLLEGNKRPLRPIPNNFIEIIEQSLDSEAKRHPLLSRAVASQFFSLHRSDLDYASNVVKSIAVENGLSEQHESIVATLDLACNIAVSNRDLELAENIASALTEICADNCSEHWIQLILIFLLQSAAAIESHDQWLAWLDEKLSIIASHIPANSNLIELLNNHLVEFENILPANSWFHSNAKSIVLAA